MKLDDKIALVTGAASGIGLATARALAEAGAAVVLTDVAEDAGAAAAATLSDAGFDVGFVPLDVTDRDNCAAVAADVIERHDRLDILVNAAGWDQIQPFVDNTPEYMDTIVELNLMGPVNVTQAMLPALTASGSGRIVNVASDAGRVGSTGETVYAGAKGGVIAFTKSLAREVTRNQIRVNCVCPGPTDTPLFAAQPEKMREALTRAIPMRRLAQPSEIADAIVFFASDRSSFVTGQVLSVSGGLTMVD
ncbi:MAG: SDR family oxidoreductase [Ilumatobacter sp.]|nr:SDR family oxidoreductase [Ilumatobacter sp.]